MLKIELNKSFTVAGIKWNVIDKVEEGYLCIAESIGKREFGRNNDWRKSYIREELKQLAEKIEKELGIELPEFERNLLSLDGEDEYGTCKDKVSLLTFDEYRKYKKVIPRNREWWWTITPDSTPNCTNDYWITVVAPSGSINCIDCNDVSGVRPVCIFPSCIFES